MGQVSADVRDKLKDIKLAYGAGPDGVRGITYFKGWHDGGRELPFVAMSANCEESLTQLAGTTVHELAHVAAGWQAAHGKEWKDCAAMLGLRNAKAAGHRYMLSGFEPWLRDHVAMSMSKVSDGKPTLLSPAALFGGNGLFGGLQGGAMPVFKLRPCGAGRGTKGGKSFGPGSGSRLRKYVCGCEPPVILRHAGDALACTCDHCLTAFVKPN